MILTGRQFREGRLLTGMTQTDLAKVAKVDLTLLMRTEAVAGLLMLKKQDAAAIQRALEAASVEFIPEKGGGPGVRLRKADP